MAVIEFGILKKFFERYKIFIIKTNSLDLNSNNPELISNASVNVYTGVFYSSSRHVIQSFFGVEKFLILSNISFTKKINQQSIFTSIQHGPWDNYYHWYIDSLPRIWWLHSKYIKDSYPIMLYINKELKPIELDFLKELLPKNVKIIEIEKGTLVYGPKAIYLPFLSNDCSGKLPRDYLNFYLEKSVIYFNLKETQDSPSKVFISRKNAERRIRNENEVVDIMKQSGYVVIKCETLSIAEQAQLFYNADKIVAQHGAALTNLLYARKADVIEIFHSPNTHLNHYKDLCLQKGLKYTPIYFDGKDKNSDITIDIATLKSII